jgi:alpha-L-arabinofuranosidase
MAPLMPPLHLRLFLVVLLADGPTGGLSAGLATNKTGTMFGGAARPSNSPPAFPTNSTVITIRSVHETSVGLRHCHNALYASQWAEPNGNKADFFWVAESPSLNGSTEHISLRSLQEAALYIAPLHDPALEANRLGAVDRGAAGFSASAASWRAVASWRSGAPVWSFVGHCGNYLSLSGNRTGVCADRYSAPSSDAVASPDTLALDRYFTVARGAGPAPPGPPAPAPPPPRPRNTTVTVSVRPTELTQPITPFMGSACGLEDINHQINGGIYSQMLADESFETSSEATLYAANGTSGVVFQPKDDGQEPTSSWRAVNMYGGVTRTTRQATIVTNSSATATRAGMACANGLRCLELMAGGAVSQSGLLDSGLFLVAGKPYDFGAFFAAKSAADKLTVTVSLRDRASGRVLASSGQRVKVRGGWKYTNLTLMPAAGSANATLVIEAAQDGAESEQARVAQVAQVAGGGGGAVLRVDQVLLEPGLWGKYKGLPVRRDLAELIELEQLTAMRLGGGMIDSNGYAWKNQVGPRHLRQPNLCGVWDTVMSNGWGVFDFLSLMEAAGVRPVVSVHLGAPNTTSGRWLCSDVSPHQDNHDSGGWLNITDPAGYIEYLFSTETTRGWGKQRLADRGHPEPYNPFLMALSNEEGCTAAYVDRAEAFMSQAVAQNKALSKPVKLSFAFACDASRNNPWQTNPFTKRLTELATSLVKQNAGLVDVFWDQHVNGDEVNAPVFPRDFVQIFENETAQTAAWGFAGGIPIVVLEENGNTHTMNRAIGHAANTFSFSKLGEHVQIVSYANCFQPAPNVPKHYSQGGKMFLAGGPPAAGQGHNRTWLSPHGYASQLLSSSYLPQGVDCAFDETQLNAMAAINASSKDLAVRLLNTGPDSITVSVKLTDGSRIDGDRSRSYQVMSGADLAADNSWSTPTAVSPKPSVSSVAADGSEATQSLPPFSFAVLKLGLKTDDIASHAGRRDALVPLSLLLLLLCSPPGAAPHPLLPVDRVVGRWDQPPAKVPSDSMVDGPLFGNGKFAGVLSSDAGGASTGPSCATPPCTPSRGEVRTFVGMNDFYAAPTNGFSSCGYPDLDGSNKPGMKQVGGITFVSRELGATPQLKFNAEQRPSNATVLVELTGGGMQLSVRTWAHATEPLMLSELTYLADPTAPRRQLELQVEAWTVLGCGMGSNPLVEDSFLPVATGANTTATTTAAAAGPTAIWASRDNGFEYQQQPGVYNLTRAIVASAVLSGSGGAKFHSALGQQQCLPAAAAQHYGGSYLPCAVGNLTLAAGQTVTLATVVVSDRQLGWTEPPLEYALRTLGQLASQTTSAVAAGGAAREHHELWWREYWSRSWIDWSPTNTTTNSANGTELVMEMYYQNLCVHICSICSRSPAICFIFLAQKTSRALSAARCLSNVALQVHPGTQRRPELNRCPGALRQLCHRRSDALGWRSHSELQRRGPVLWRVAGQSAVATGRLCGDDQRHHPNGDRPGETSVSTLRTRGDVLPWSYPPARCAHFGRHVRATLKAHNHRRPHSYLLVPYALR